LVDRFVYVSCTWGDCLTNIIEQLLVLDRKVPLEEMCAKIDEVTTDSLREVATKVFGPDVTKQATVVCMGHDDVSDWKAVLRRYGVGGGR
jgi:processing peptidase subunit alpha